MDLDGKRVVITGGATGIGRATAMYCAGKGARVVVADVSRRDAEDCVAQIRSAGGEGWFLHADVSSEPEVESMMAEAERLMGGIDALVTAAGIARDTLVPVDELPTEGWDITIEVNLRGTFLSAKHAVPALRRAGGGVIVLIASGAGVSEASSMVAYGASKGGVNGLGMTLEAALAPDAIRVNVLCPGNIATPLKLRIVEEQAGARGDEYLPEEQIARLGDPEGMARVLGFLVSDAADYVRGAVFTR
jgi:NAD(P)-dependent dehydrogenase (short-subunit alcohol dehydrogenase family)